MLKLNAAYAKKVPAESDYSSQSFHAALELELADGLSNEQLREKIHATFELVRNAVEAELTQLTANSQVSPDENFSPPPNNTPEIEYASKRQVKFLLDLATRNGADLASELEKCGVTKCEELSKEQCSRLIDLIRKTAKAA